MTEVIYNHDCPICSREIAMYRAEADRNDLPLTFTPLDRAALADWGLTPEDAARRLHVVQNGNLLSGTDAFLALWSALPKWRWFARVVGLPGIRHVAAVVYEALLAPALFALHRRRETRRVLSRSQ